MVSEFASTLVWVHMFKVYIRILHLFENNFSNFENNIHILLCIITGLTRHKVSNLGSLMSYVEEGIKARKTASTLQNPNSSRSHALLTVSLSPVSPNNHSATATAKEKDFHRGSKLHLVDLAGSESAATCSGINRLKVSHHQV